MIFRLAERWIHSRVALILLPLSWLWRGVAFLRNRLFDCGIFVQHRVAKPVVSIGNLAVGGTGKTPLVIALARALAHRRVAIVLRGYGKDEGEVMRRHLPGVRVYEDANRVRGAQQAIREGAELILLDDGFQHRQLQRDFDLLLVRAQDVRGHCLPAGPLRESPRRYRAADLLFCYDTIPNAVQLKTKARRVLTLQGEEVTDLCGARVALFCGIANPARFQETVRDLGALPVIELFLGDHEPIGQKRLYKLYKLNVKYLICTEKDAVKLPPCDLPVVYVEIETVIVKGGELWQNLIEKIEQKIDN